MFAIWRTLEVKHWPEGTTVSRKLFNNPDDFQHTEAFGEVPKCPFE